MPVFPMSTNNFLKKETAKRQKRGAGYLIFISAALLPLCCAADSYFDKMSSGYYVVTQVRQPDGTETDNALTPLSLSVAIKRIELIAAASDTTGFLVYENTDFNLTHDRFIRLPVYPERYKAVFDSRHPVAAMTVHYAKVYLYAVSFAIPATNFNNSVAVNRAEEFYVFYNQAAVDGLQFFRANAAALDVASGSVEYFDSTKATVTPLANAGGTRFNVGLSGAGSDAFGYYEIIPCNSFPVSENQTLLINLVFDMTNTFIWTDVLSGAGVFDGASADVFNWNLKPPVYSVNIQEL
jgi:hypothetical protein